MDELRVAQEFNQFLAIPSLTVIFCILFLLAIQRWRSLLFQNLLIAAFIVTLLFMNFLEVLTFGNLYTNYDFSIRAYNCTAIILASLFLCLGENLNADSGIDKRFLYSIIILTSSLLIWAILFTDIVISGYSVNAFSIFRNPGDLYWLFQIFAFLCITLGVYFITRGIFLATNDLDRKRYRVILISFFPLVITSFLVLIFMHFGANLNLSLFLPICTLLFITVYLFTESRHDLFRFLVNVPYSPERAAYKALNNRVIEYISKTQTNEKLPLKEFMHDIETAIIENVLEIKDGNHSLTAELLSVSLSTVYRNKKKKDG